MSKITNDGLTWSARHRMLYSSTHMATVGVKGLTHSLNCSFYFYCLISTFSHETQQFNFLFMFYIWPQRARLG